MSTNPLSNSLNVKSSLNGSTNFVPPKTTPIKDDDDFITPNKFTNSNSQGKPSCDKTITTGKLGLIRSPSENIESPEPSSRNATARDL